MLTLSPTLAARRPRPVPRRHPRLLRRRAPCVHSFHSFCHVAALSTSLLGLHARSIASHRARSSLLFPSSHRQPGFIAFSPHRRRTYQLAAPSHGRLLRRCPPSGHGSVRVRGHRRLCVRRLRCASNPLPCFRPRSPSLRARILIGSAPPLPSDEYSSGQVLHARPSSAARPAAPSATAAPPARRARAPIRTHPNTHPHSPAPTHAPHRPATRSTEAATVGVRALVSLLSLRRLLSPPFAAQQNHQQWRRRHSLPAYSFERRSGRGATASTA